MISEHFFCIGNFGASANVWNLFFPLLFPQRPLPIFLYQLYHYGLALLPSAGGDGLFRFPSELCKFCSKWHIHCTAKNLWGFFWCLCMQTTNILLPANCSNILFWYRSRAPALEFCFRDALYELCSMVLSFFPPSLHFSFACNPDAELLVTYQGKNNWMWCAESFICDLSDSWSNCLSLRKKRLFPLSERSAISPGSKIQRNFYFYACC